MKKSTTVFISIFFFWTLSIFIINPINAQIQNWPQFRGTNCSGIAAEGQNPPISFGPDKNILWKASLPEGHSSPCIWGDCIFITGIEKEEKLFKLFCIDRNDGTIRWEEGIVVEELERTLAVGNPATATPSSDGERVYYYFGSYGLLCYDINGEKLWELSMPIPKSRHEMGTSPIVTGDLLILNCFGDQNDPQLLALDKYDGSTVWIHTLPEQEEYIRDSYATPVIYKDEVIIYASDYVAGYEIETGDLKWRFVIDVVDAASTPVIGKDILYTISYSAMGNPTMRAQFPDFIEFAAKYDENRDLKLERNEIKDFWFLLNPEMPEIPGYNVPMMYVMGWWDANQDGFIDSTEWKNVSDRWEARYHRQGLKAIKLGGEGDIGLNYFIWGHTDDVPYVSSPLFFKDHIYMIKNGGIISCFQAESGELLYKEKLGASGTYFSSPIAANGRIYIASRNGIVTVFEAGDELNILAHNDLNEKIMATPAVVDNKLYIRTAGSLYAFGE
jgi:outer membrane protein assembly factor BamB